MIEVYPGLFVGTRGDCPLQSAKPAGTWATVHVYLSCYRQALGERTPDASEAPASSIARRDAHLFVNLLDAQHPAYIHKEAQIDPVLDFMEEIHTQGSSLLVHCEQGWSRSPSLVLLYLATRLGVLPTVSLSAAEARFKTLYPGYAPSYGIWAHLHQHWQQYCADGQASRNQWR